MNKLIIYEYMMKLGRDDIKRFANNQNIILNNQEIDIIYSYIKKDSRRILNKPDDVIMEIKSKINPIAYDKLIELYNKYKDKIS